MTYLKLPSTPGMVTWDTLQYTDAYGWFLAGSFGALSRAIPRKEADLYLAGLALPTPPAIYPKDYQHDRW